MCGIFGIYAHPRRSRDHAPRPVLAAAPRAGIGGHRRAATRVTGARASKSNGSCLRRIRSQDVARLAGDLAIGHTRYSTAGSSTIENAQPVLARVRGTATSALAHNGNLTNATELKHELERRGSIFTSTMDSEVLVHRIARSLARQARAAASPMRSCGVEGAYSLVVDRSETTLLAARDPRGWRPLVMGKLGDSIVFASETCALDIVGATVVREVERGEIIAVDARRNAIDRSRFRSARVEEVRLRVRVFRAAGQQGLRRIGGSCATRAGTAPRARMPRPGAELVFSVPDSSNSAALGFAEESKLPFELALIRNHYVGRTFIQPTQAGRDAKVKVKYNAVREVLDGKSVVMVDDSIVRGTTTRGLVAWFAQRVRAKCTCASARRRSPVPATTESIRPIATS